ncbi:MAG: LptF/LptG family permease [Cyclobacteriaceae bacterium]|nr:LptF/LptG family permease [Cyclobacteriaceae bacterium SS2]
MLKLDRLILKSFIGPFILTTALATFILLIQYMLKYFDDFVGKDLGFMVFAELILYFSLNMLQVALPLGVLVSSLMTFGTLGEHFELTAIKSAGLSLIRVLLPVFFFVVVLSYGAFLFNNHIVPSSNLKAFSLLYDIKKKKPGLDIKEGVFYGGIPDYSIKAKEKLSDNSTLKDVIIYDHTQGTGNNTVILADSSKMYTLFNDRYLKLELYNGNYYYDEEGRRTRKLNRLTRTNFDRMDIVFSLSSFDLKRTKEELFQNNRQMKNIEELTEYIDSLSGTMLTSKYEFIRQRGGFYYHMSDKIDMIIDHWGISEDSLKKMRMDPATLSEDEAERQRIAEEEASLAENKEEQEQDTTSVDEEADSALASREEADVSKTIKKDSTPEDNSGAGRRAQLLKAGAITSKIMDEKLAAVNIDMDKPPGTVIASKNEAREPELLVDTLSWAFLDEKMKDKESQVILSAKNAAQKIKVNISSMSSRLYMMEHDIYKYEIELYKKYSQAVACIVMFLIGAPLGAIIKKGGLGVPVLISILFFIIYYVLTIMTEKWAKEGIVDPVLAVWTADAVLFPIGLFFLRQARIDARIFDSDVYAIWMEKFLSRFSKKLVR